MRKNPADNHRKLNLRIHRKKLILRQVARLAGYQLFNMKGMNKHPYPASSYIEKIFHIACKGIFMVVD